MLKKKKKTFSSKMIDFMQEHLKLPFQYACHLICFFRLISKKKFETVQDKCPILGRGHWLNVIITLVMFIIGLIMYRETCIKILQKVNNKSDSRRNSYWNEIYPHHVQVACIYFEGFRFLIIWYQRGTSQISCESQHCMRLVRARQEI